MSKFFSSIEEEKKDNRKKKDSFVKQEEDKTPKKEKKMAELQTRVFGLIEEENQREFDKQFKKLVTELKKYEHCFDGEVPLFLLKLFKDKRCQAKQHKSLVNKFLEKYEEEVVEEEKRVVKVDAQTLFEKVLCIKDSKVRMQECLHLKNNTSGELKIKILQTLISMFMKSKDDTLFLEVLLELVEEILKNPDAVERFKDLLDHYLGKIFAGLRNDQVNDYIKLLNLIQQINSDFANSRMLQLKFFRLNENVENDHKLFSALYYARLDNVNLSKRKYLENKHFYGTDNISLKILFELGHYFLNQGEFEIAFGILEICYNNNMRNVENQLFILCIILNKEVSNSKIFKVFIEGFRELEKNKLLLRSGNEKMEIYRAFYLLHCYDISNSTEIIRNILPGFKNNKALEQYVIQKILN